MMLSFFLTFLLMAVVITFVRLLSVVAAQMPKSPYAAYWRDSTTRRYEPLVAGMQASCYLLISIMAGIFTGIVSLSMIGTVDPISPSVGVTVILVGLFLRRAAKQNSDLSPRQKRLSAGKRFGGAVFFILGACLFIASLFTFLVGNLAEMPVISGIGFVYLAAGIGMVLAAQLRFWGSADDEDDTFVSPWQVPLDTTDHR